MPIMVERDVFVEDIEEDDLGSNWGRFLLDILRELETDSFFPFHIVIYLKNIEYKVITQFCIS